MIKNSNKETSDQDNPDTEIAADETVVETPADGPSPEDLDAAASDADPNPPEPEITPADGPSPEDLDAAASDAEPNPSEPEITPAEEIAELKDKLLRSLAENENQIRRARRDREDATKYAAANFARDMLGVADNIRRALEAVPDGLNQDDPAVKAFLDGISLTEREFLTALERHGITKISPLGNKFDHDRHEVLFEVPTNDADPGTVMQVVEEGYIIHDRLLRAARVGVAKGLAPPADEDDDHQIDTTG